MSFALKSDAPMPGRLAMTLMLGLLVSFAPMTIDLYLPAMPLMARDLMTDAESIQLTLSVYMVGFALAQNILWPHLGPVRTETDDRVRDLYLSRRQRRLPPWPRASSN